MTCEELRTHLEGGFQTDCGGAAEHLRLCSDCRSLVEEQENLRAALLSVREAVVPIPESLDAAVLAEFRRYATGQSQAVDIPKFRPAVVLAWSAVAAVLLLSAALVLSSGRERAVKVAEGNAQQRTSRRLSLENASSVAPHVLQPAPKHAVAAAPKHVVRPPVRAVQHPVRPANAPVPLNAGFRSLMFCDKLSCDGAMQVIRVQLPAEAVATPPSGFVPTSGRINADVLVGADGIARGIRVIQ